MVSTKPAAGQILSHALYDNFDKFSFSLAELRYPASGGKHRIPVGNFILLQVMDTLNGSDVKNVTLSKFSSDCNVKGLVLPEVECYLTYEIKWTERNLPARVSGTAQRNIGNLMVKEDEMILGQHIDYGDKLIVSRASSLANDMIDDFKRTLQKQ